MATNPIHEQPTRNWPKRSGAMSEEEFHELERLNPDRKYEYINGMAYMRRGCTVGHDRITRNISASLDKYLTGSCTFFGVDVQVLVSTADSKRHYVYPDATVSCHDKDKCLDNMLIESPRVVFEILAPKTEARDRGIKFKAYQSCPTIQEIVLVNQYLPYIQIWQRDEQNVEMWKHRYYSFGATVEFAGIDVRVEIEELYQGLNFVLDDDEDEE